MENTAAAVIERMKADLAKLEEITGGNDQTATIYDALEFLAEG